MPSLDFDQDVNFGKFRTTEPAISSKDKAYAEFRNIPKDKNLDHWENLYTDEIRQSKLNYEADATPDVGLSRQESELNASREQLLPINDTIFQVLGKYIVSSVKSGLLLVDQVRANERILYERFIGQLANRSGNAQQCMFPVNIELNPGDFALVMELQDEIAALGFAFEEFGGNCIVINATPAGLPASNEKRLFEGLLEQFKMNKSALTISVQDNLARAMARKAAVNDGQQLNREEVRALIDGLFACENPNYDPSGRKTFFILDLKQIENLFN
jgi:DNA mismatch repair protein MutL